MLPYVVRGHTSEPWSNATLSFYAATANATGSAGAYKLDRVTLAHRSQQPANRTECVDPLAPASGGSTSGDLIVNGTFSGGSISPWTLFGAITSQLTNGVFKFFRPSGTPPGVVLQNTGVAMGQDQRFAASLELGNSSGALQRVTVVVHDVNFTDSTSCAFWLPPGQPLSRYDIRGYATQGYSNLALSVYPGTVGSSATHQWLKLDNVTLEKTTDPVLGTECIEPDVTPGTTVQVTLDLTGSGTGTVSSTPNGLLCQGGAQTCTGQFTVGTSVTLTATPGSGMTFQGWGGVCTGTGGGCSFTVEVGQLVTAAFAGPAALALTYYHTDALGSVRAVTDAADATVTRHDYFPFGESASPMAGDPRRFLGQERDVETGYDYFGARYYRNIFGRFNATDPIVNPVATVHPQRWNRYAYALNNPLRFADPSGLDADAEEPGTEEGASHCSEICKDFFRWAEWLYVELMIIYYDEQNQSLDQIITSLPPGTVQAIQQAVDEANAPIVLGVHPMSTQPIYLPGGNRETGFAVHRLPDGTIDFFRYIPGHFQLPGGLKYDYAGIIDTSHPRYNEIFQRELIAVHVHPPAWRIPPYCAGPCKQDWAVSKGGQLNIVVSPNNNRIYFYGDTVGPKALEMRLDQFYKRAK